MMQSIRTREDLEDALVYIRMYADRIKKLQTQYERYRAMVVRYLEINNRKSVTEDDGTVWQKRQNTSISYQLDDLRKLLRHHRINPTTVIVSRTVEEVDEDALIKLLKAEVISVEEFEEVAIRHTGRPFIVRVPNAKRKSKTPVPIGSRRPDQNQYRHDSAGRRTKLRKIGHRRRDQAAS